MPIDDPFDAMEETEQAERRSEIVPFKEEGAIAVGALLSIAGAASAAASDGSAALAAGIGAAALTAFQAVVSTIGLRRQRQLIDELHREFQERGVSREYLERRLREAGESIQELVAESVVRASEAKSAEAVKRVATLLTTVLLTEEEVNIEEVRAMLVIAANLFDLDGVILGRMYEIQAPAVTHRGGAINVNDGTESWKRLVETHPQLFKTPSIIAAGSQAAILRLGAQNRDQHHHVWARNVGVLNNRLWHSIL